MKKPFFFYAALVLLAARFSVAADEGERLVMMQVDEVVVPKSMHFGEPLEVSIVGLLRNGCQRFERLEISETQSAATIAMWAAERRAVDVLCTADIRPVKQTRTFSPETRGRFVLTVKQPGGSVTMREVSVD